MKGRSSPKRGGNTRKKPMEKHYILLESLNMRAHEIRPTTSASLPCKKEDQKEKRKINSNFAKVERENKKLNVCSGEREKAKLPKTRKRKRRVISYRGKGTDQEKKARETKSPKGE